MSEISPENSEFHPENLEITSMSACAEAASLLRSIAEPRPIGDTVKAAILRAARRTGLKVGRVEDLWRQEARAVRAEEMDAIRRAAQKRLVREAKHELTELDARIARLEALLVRDEDFHRTEADALRSMAGGDHRAVDRGGQR